MNLIKDTLASNPKRLFWISFFFNLSALSSIFTLFYLHRGLSLVEISFLGVITSLAIVLFEVPTGIIADIVGRKKSVIFGILFLIAHGIIYIFAHNFLLFAIGIILFALAITFFSGCVTAIIYDSLKALGKEKEAKTHMGKYRSAQILAAICIPPFASYIARNLSPEQFIILLLINLVGYLIALMIALTLHETPHKDSSKKKGKFLLLRETIKQFVSNKNLLRLSINQGLGFVCILIFTALLWQPYFQQTGIPVALFGSLLAASNIFSFILFRKVNIIENFFGTKTTFFITSFLPGLILLSMAFFKNIPIAIAGFFIVGIFIPLRDPLFMAYKNHLISSYNRATMISIMAMLYALFAAILQPIVGFLADISLTYSFFLLGSILILNSLIFFIRSKDLVHTTQ